MVEKWSKSGRISGKLLEKEALGSTFKEGQRFFSNASDNDIKEFTDNFSKQL